jgi:tRNA nucleotidyltransferase (CCA-adding enzyme)
MNLNKAITPGLRKLRDAFVANGFDLRLVGGVVRDLARGVEPKDVDLCTDADPVDQIMIYKGAGVPYYETGLAHGTISVRIDGETYEITSLRTETDHDGRHATVSYTRDWLGDLGRRDLTFNAMALTFDGELIDPFNGLQDLKDGVVRFVGNPDDRMREDYLRILRWLRFHGRMAADQPLDPETVEAAQRQTVGLQGISRERVWMEVSKIISGNGGDHLIDSMYDLDIAGNIGLPMGNVDRLRFARFHTRNPVTLMVALLNRDGFPDMATAWKWSAEERDLANFLSVNDTEHVGWLTLEAFMKLVAFDGHSVEWAMELARMHGNMTVVMFLEKWTVPVFPVKGQDLLDGGMKPGPQMGVVLKGLKKKWMESGYTLDKETLLSGI